MTLGELFREEPGSWGRRGDPYLWRALAERLQGADLPDEAASLVAAIEAAYRDLVGQPITVDESAFVARFAHGGMSSGQVSPEFWRSTAIPLLVQRFHKLRER